ncbi:hypothetical protein CAOG_05708 [Capsaspora owczarzaki ATCC 30864]|uniref:DUF4326 domain-containing protein n=1 Tax=Capsaspora owczarzaki (strain ATCC 30864) TaxID=595528 RepID=A0A0D2UJG6_CAPO3|nr:hypothetical protein CAOG_05708 [Capsaspora owczarzaki ATCC 30864]KJE95231.1 hypothetical protein CAOG_005708 [Capsaspora owczarzaki ATCC 30864]|eukprot:XP_004346381.1 hypothetical protein CAOG_05708 [Capsaspora owczarzaki ATCC 30864]
MASQMKHQQSNPEVICCPASTIDTASDDSSFQQLHVLAAAESAALTKQFRQRSLQLVAEQQTRVVRLKRKNGAVVQGCDIYIGRACNQGGWHLPSSKWANPFSVSKCGSRKEAVRRFEQYLLSRPDLLAALPELRGKVLGCWCAPELCHGHILAKLANA